MERERGLAVAIEAILESYRLHGNINHIEATALPSRARVTQLLDELTDLVFPGYFGDDNLDELVSGYVIGERCARLYRDLAQVIYRSFRVQQAECGSEQRKDLRARADELALSLLGSVPSVRDVLASDVQAALHGDPAAGSAEEVILSYPGVQAITSHRIAHQLYLLDVPMLPRMMSEVTHSRTGIDIHPGAQIGPSFFIDHGTGVVMGETTRIGARVKLYQGVTLGALSVRGRDDARGKKRHPTLEDDVTIYAGATILGGETVIGRGSTIGGNVWLTRSVAPGTTVVLDTPSLVFKER
jgi:serine O-acetyltransferase